MKRSLASLVAVILLSLTPSLARAQTDGPPVVVSIAGYDQLMKSMTALSAIVGMPLDQMVQQQITGLTGGQGLQGMDKSKPIVGALNLGDGEPTVTLCLPITNLQQFLGTLPPPFAQTEDAGGGVLKLTGTPEPTYVKDAGGWVYVSDSVENLASAPADPAATAGDLPTKYAVAIQASVQALPKEQRDGLISFLKMQAVQNLQQSGADPIQINVMNKQLERLQKISDEINQVTAGLAIDEAAKKVVLEFTVTAVPGSQTAAEYSALKDGPTNFAGFLAPNAAITGLVAYDVPKNDEDLAILDLQQQQAKTKALQNIDADPGIPGDVKAIVKDAVGTLIDVGFNTLKQNKFDAGLAVFVDDKSTMVAGGAVSDGAALETALKQIIDIGQKDGSIPPINLDALTHGGYNFHTMILPVPIPQAQGFIGPQLEVVLGTGADAIFIGVGGNAIAQLKSIIDASQAAKGQTVTPFQLNIALAPFAAAAAQLDESGAAAQAAQSLQQNGSIRITSLGIENGAVGRIEIEENVIKSIGMVVPMLMQAGAGGPGGPPGGLDDFPTDNGADPFGGN